MIQEALKPVIDQIKEAIDLPRPTGAIKVGLIFEVVDGKLCLKEGSEVRVDMELKAE